MKLTPNIRKQLVDHVGTRKISGPWEFLDFVDDISGEARCAELELSDEDAKSIVAEGLALRSDGAGKVQSSKAVFNPDRRELFVCSIISSYPIDAELPSPSEVQEIVRERSGETLSLDEAESLAEEINRRYPEENERRYQDSVRSRQAGTFRRWEDMVPKPTNNGRRAKRVKGFKPARRVTRSAETWRILKNYPEYEISNFGRVRSLDRADPHSWLKPRFVWHRGKIVTAVILCSGGKRYSRFIGPLMIQAGFLKEPKWMAKTQTV